MNMKQSLTALGMFAAAAVIALAACSDTAAARFGNRDAFLDQFDTRNLQVAPDTLLRGGPEKDGIPALRNPAVARSSDAGFLDLDDRVVGVQIGGVSRAYPIRLLNWHEVVNDDLGGVPIAVVYCPLCDSASVIDRRMDGTVLEFGVSGLLHNSNVVLYDRTYQALWSQIGFRALSGPHAGRPLKHLPFTLTTFQDWRKTNPDSTVVTFDTGHPRNYSGNPYAAYFQRDEIMFPLTRRLDKRLPAKARVLGVQAGAHTRAYPIEKILAAQRGRVEDTLGGARLVFKAMENGGVSVLEAPEDARIVHTFWFAWAAFHPDTELYGGRSSRRAR